MNKVLMLREVRGALSIPSGELAMHDFIKRFANGVFYPEEVDILSAAFDDAWAKLQATRAPFAEKGYASTAREILATHIIMAAMRGERNTRHLSQDALLLALTAEIDSKAAA